MKKLRKLKDGAGKGGAVGSGIGSVAAGSSGIGGGLPKELSKASVRPWIFEHHRRLRRANLKRHEIRHMDLTEREAQLIWETKGNGDFLKSGQEMTADDSNGTVKVKAKKKEIIVSAVGTAFALSVGTALLIFILFG